MYAITKYKTADGCEFSEPDKAEAHEALIARVASIMAGLPKPPSSGRVQVNVERVAEAKRKIVELCRELWPTEDVFKHPAENIHPMSYAGRFIDDAAPKPLHTAWHFFMCNKGEWLYEQPYFALHPNEFKEVSASGRWEQRGE